MIDYKKDDWNVIVGGYLMEFFCRLLYFLVGKNYINMLNIWCWVELKFGYLILCFKDIYFIIEIELFIEMYIKFIWLFCFFFNNNFKLNIYSEIEDNDGNFLVIDIIVEEI